MPQQFVNYMIDNGKKPNVASEEDKKPKEDCLQGEDDQKNHHHKKKKKKKWSGIINQQFIINWLFYPCQSINIIIIRIFRI